MSIIRVLPPGLQNQIAAGEVVERPSSVVKELMENSLDAGAKNIQVHLKAGGQSLIQVSDDGAGMKPDDLPLALTRHATSKISDINELSRVSSFGFRGEALPSIASISQLTISSCPAGHNEGFFIKLLYGKEMDKGPVAMPQGTRIKVENLLSNVPARLKFLKTTTTENKKCVEAFIRHCLANLGTDFELFSESRSMYRFFPGETLLQRLEVIWPSQICENLQEINLDNDDMSITGLVSKPESTQARADRILFYVNKRPVNDRMLMSALRQAYKGRLISREYPQAVLFINVPSMDIDVNVHPAKNEIRFRNEKQVFSLIVRAIGSTLSTDIYQSAETSSGSSFPDISSNNPYTDNSEQPAENFSYSKRDNTDQESLFKRLREKKSDYYSQFCPPEVQSVDSFSSQPPKHGSATIKKISYMGQVENSYLLFSKPDSSLLIVDQHAAHERVMFEKIKKGYQKTIIKRLAIPESIFIHSSQHEVFENIWKKLKNLGFILKMTPDKKLIVSGIPDFMSHREALSFLEDILSQKKQDLDEIFITMACRTSIKAGTGMTPDEACGLMDKLLSCDNNEFCPHGRPIIRILGGKELEKMFKRK
ncbi:MAG: DNA mismatch repair endonuclease MutL [Desulfonatronovibrio sp. MSAO_Bac4]|nr:MAG: DNA mismatch repair endonuclease MutL [Desulfonatronovibrio sp. MSAO_Bac4]